MIRHLARLIPFYSELIILSLAGIWTGSSRYKADSIPMYYRASIAAISNGYWGKEYPSKQRYWRRLSGAQNSLYSLLRLDLDPNLIIDYWTFFRKQFLDSFILQIPNNNLRFQIFEDLTKQKRNCFLMDCFFYHSQIFGELFMFEYCNFCDFKISDIYILVEITDLFRIIKPLFREITRSTSGSMITITF